MRCYLEKTEFEANTSQVGVCLSFEPVTSSRTTCSSRMRVTSNSPTLDSRNSASGSVSRRHQMSLDVVLFMKFEEKMETFICSMFSTIVSAFLFMLVQYKIGFVLESRDQHFRHFDHAVVPDRRFAGVSENAWSACITY